MNKYKTIDEFLDDQIPERLAEINMIRSLILKSEPALAELIKWNAPSYVYKGEDRITFNLLNKQNQLRLLIHMKKKKKEDKKAKPILIEDEGIVEWNSDIRGTIVFDGISDIESKKLSLQKVIKRWLAISVA